MNPQERNTEKILTILKNSKPLLTQQDLLTDKIMNALPTQKSKNVIFLNFVRVISGVAAVFLIGLFTYQQTDNQTVFSVHTGKILNFTVNSSYCDINTVQAENVTQSYRTYLNRNVLKNRQSRAFNKQFKQIYDENND